MFANVAANLVADVVWAPLVWLAVREWRRHRRVLEQAHQRTHELLRALHERLDAVTGPDDSRDWEDA